MDKIWVLCIDNSGSYTLTNGKIYQVEETIGTLYRIIDESGEQHVYYKTRFKIIDIKREDWGIQTASA